MTFHDPLLQDAVDRIYGDESYSLDADRRKPSGLTRPALGHHSNNVVVALHVGL